MTEFDLNAEENVPKTLVDLMDQLNPADFLDKTSTTLVEDLQKAAEEEKDKVRKTRIKKIIENAKSLAYDDFNSKDGLPKITLVTDLNAVHLTTLSKKVMNGDYD